MSFYGQVNGRPFLLLDCHHDCSLHGVAHEDKNVKSVDGFSPVNRLLLNITIPRQPVPCEKKGRPVTVGEQGVAICVVTRMVRGGRDG